MARLPKPNAFTKSSALTKTNAHPDADVRAQGDATPAEDAASQAAALRLRHDLHDDLHHDADHEGAEGPHALTSDSKERFVPERRSGFDQRRAANRELAPEGVEDDETGLARRRGVGRRRSDWARAAEEGEMTREQFLFIKAIDGFKRANDVMYPTWTDVLEVIRLLGYRKTRKCELNIPGAEDWTEKSDALSGVRSKPGHPEQALPRREVA